MLIVLPCTIKQDIKQSLNIPIQEERFEKPDKNATCASVKQDLDEITAPTFSTDQEISTADTDFHHASVHSLISRYHNAVIYPREVPTSPVPLFILHEVYRI